MTMKLKNNEEIKKSFDQLFDQLSEKDKIENQAAVLMFRFLSLVEDRCKEFGWNRRKLSEEVGTSASYISQLFRGNKLANLIILAKFQQVLGIEFEISSNVSAKTEDYLVKSIASEPTNEYKKNE
jgi:ribosome-binding protein aMBF1 (putative translation factor)